MFEKERVDSRDLAALLKELPQEDLILTQGIITGMNLARKMNADKSGEGQEPAATA